MFTADEVPVCTIDNDEALAMYCRQWSELDCLAIDSEFIRSNTFYAKLGLLQIGDGKQCALIDPLSIADWRPFKALLSSPERLFVCHSCSEDLNVLLTRFDCLPARLFDTQIAAGFLGLGFSLSYQALVELMLGVTVAKEETRSDWLQRPLLENQRLYAALDVRYLHDLCERLSQSLREQGKMDWFSAVCAQQLADAGRVEQETSWAQSYTLFGNAWRLNRRGLTLLQGLCVWREREARRRDRPKNWIAKDNELQAIATHFSRAERAISHSEIAQVSDLSPALRRHHGESLVKLLEGLSNLPAEQTPGDVPKPLQPAERDLLKRCQSQVRRVADEHEMAPELLARKKQLVALLNSCRGNGSPDWQGPFSDWQRQLLQPVLDPLLKGVG